MVVGIVNIMESPLEGNVPNSSVETYVSTLSIYGARGRAARLGD
jgi:hypothetical protein